MPEVCDNCKKPIPEGKEEYRTVKAARVLGANGTEQPGNPIDVDLRPLCPECAAKHDE